MKLVIVESPAKAKTIGRFLGKDYHVVASYGHVRDLPSSAEEIPEEIKDQPWSRMGVDTTRKYKPYYVVPKESRKTIAELRKHVKEADEIILATDEDREGESISWHLVEELKPKVPVKRIAFHEITKSAIEEALANPRKVDQKLVDAQESRRILDRLYGYSLSPVLWKKIAPKLSAGRVQSVAVRLVVEREEERKAFKVSEYWDVEAALKKNGIEFSATLVSLDGKRLASGRDFDANSGELKSSDVVWLREDAARKLATTLGERVPWKTVRVEQKEAKLRPDPPFITSTLQRAASSILGFSPKKTMQVAQRLYEGVELGGEDREGLITYMRTDSVALSNDALNEAGKVIARMFGENYHERRAYTTKSKLAQEAHEAIRPTKLGRTPAQVEKLVPEDELRLYRLIWNRALASQMADAQLLKTTVDFETSTNDGTAILRTNGSVVTFPGFLKVADSGQKDTELPELREGDGVGPKQAITIEKLNPIKHETKPPARYTEASLIQRLEEEGIGRPSTYAPTISTIQQRGYVELQGKALIPTFLAVATTQMLKGHFGEYVDLKFTARMEDALDDIANGEQDSVEFLDGFYKGNGKFGRGLDPHIEHEMPNIEYPAIPLGDDPDTDEPLIVRIGRNGPFIQRGDGGSENTVTVPFDVTYDSLDAEMASKLLRDKAKGNEPLGRHPESGENVYALVGPYGPYVQLGEVSDENKRPKRASLPKDTALDSVSLPLALKLLSLPRVLGKVPQSGDEITAAQGRFGPYVKRGDEFRSLEASDDVYTVGLDRALVLFAQPKQTRRATKTVIATLGPDPTTGKPVEVCKGRYGPYVTNGDANASLPKGAEPEKFSFDEALALLADAPKKGSRKGASRGRKASSKPSAKAAAKPKAAVKPKAAAKKSAAKPRAAAKKK